MAAPRPTFEHCRHCGLAVIETTFDDDTNGPTLRAIRLDPTVLTPQLLLACAITGRPIWHIRRRRNGITTSRIGAWTRHRDAATNAKVPTHICGRTFTTLEHITAHELEPTRIPDTCPF